MVAVAEEVAEEVAELGKQALAEEEVAEAAGGVVVGEAELQAQVLQAHFQIESHSPY